jgi:DNA-binding protein H-NS
MIVMASYKELQEQISKLQTQAEAARQKEVAAVVAQIHELARQYLLTPEDLGFTRPVGRRRRQASAVAPKYRDPESGATWTGRGRAPRWLDGRDRTQFEIK